MKRVIMTAMAALAARGLWAMPTKAQLDAVAPVVQELMKPAQEAQRAGTKTRSDVAAEALKLVGEADSEAAKFLLIKGAFSFYVHDGAFDQAIETLETLKAAVPDIPAQNLANIIESSLRNVPKKNGGQLYQLLDETKTEARYQAELKTLEAKLAKRTGDATLETQIAEHYAVLGDWPKALDAFTRSANRRAAAAAKAEKEGPKNRKALADFWWDYPPAAKEELVRAFHGHAAAIYSAALAAGEITGLYKRQVESRIAEAGPQTSAEQGRLYCVVDLSAGSDAKKYPVSYLNDIPKGGWTDDYKSAKLVLKRVEMKGKPAYYLGVFEVTGDQWGRVMGRDPSQFITVPNHPVERVSYEDIRGVEKGCSVPVTKDVDTDSFLGKLRARTGITFDLPYEFQWENACRAGSWGAWGGPAVNDVEKFKEMAWYGDSGDAKKNGPGNAEGHTHGVGEKKPNDWGFYDMHGNVWEWTIDGFDEKKPEFRVHRGGCWGHCPAGCSSSSRRGGSADRRGNDCGFRLAIQP